MTSYPPDPARRRRQLTAAPELPRLRAQRVPHAGRPADVGGARPAVTAGRGRRPGLRRRRRGGLRRPGATACARSAGRPTRHTGTPSPRPSRSSSTPRRRAPRDSASWWPCPRGWRPTTCWPARRPTRRRVGAPHRGRDVRPRLLRADRRAHQDAADPQRRRRRLPAAGPAAAGDGDRRPARPVPRLRRPARGRLGQPARGRRASAPRRRPGCSRSSAPPARRSTTRAATATRCTRGARAARRPASSRTPRPASVGS